MVRKIGDLGRGCDLRPSGHFRIPAVKRKVLTRRCRKLTVGAVIVHRLFAHGHFAASRIEVDVDCLPCPVCVDRMIRSIGNLGRSCDLRTSGHFRIPAVKRKVLTRRRRKLTVGFIIAHCLLALGHFTASRIEVDVDCLPCPMCVDRMIRRIGDYGRCSDLRAVGHSRIPALKHVVLTRRRRQCAVCAAIIHLFAGLGHLAASRIEVYVDHLSRPMRVQRMIRRLGHLGRRRYLRAAGLLRKPAIEGIILSRRRRQCAVCAAIGDCRSGLRYSAAVRIECDGALDAGPMRVQRMI